MQNTPPSDRQREISAQRDKEIQEFLGKYGCPENNDLLAELIVTVCRLAKDNCGRGEVKLLNRALAELRYAFKVFAPYVEIPKVSIFGSARTREDDPQYQQAMKFAKLIEQAGWMVITGAGDGIMRAGHHGAKREASFGVAITLPFEQSANTIIAGDHKLINFKYFFTRKLMFVKEARAIVLFPGGFGTQDEGFEALTLVQTGKATPIPLVLCDEPGGTYWQHWRTYIKSELLHHGMIDEDDMKLFCITDDAQKAVEEILRFYRRYHSSRFVFEDLVIRLKSALSDDELAHLNQDFTDLLESGEIRQVTAALPEESGEYPTLPRLVFHYHKKNAARLRHMIDTINDVE
ncbi:MAG: LOG family protein [Phycisphaerae bacterium]|nr:LOG family protein [Phycisphaerae bacterium]